MTPVVSFRHVSKQYPIFNSPTDRIREALDPLRRTFHRPFWALRDVSFEVEPGMTVGILGVNGSGKSTLLKILCSVLQPSSGEIKVDGRIAALLELGAGFDSRLSGRANAEFHCFLNGYNHTETKELIREIQAFADIGDFFDQPMHIYSSGMFMRVAFATSINIDPDILIIDEALSVGDARFQQKCFAKFEGFQKAGKTVILVTHNRFMVPRLCNYALLLNRGSLVLAGDPKAVTDRYSEILAIDGKGESLLTPYASAGNPSSGGTRADADEAAAPRLGGLKHPVSSDPTIDYCPDNPTFNKNEVRYGLGDARIVDYGILADGEINPPTIQPGASVDIWFRIAFLQDVQHPLVGFTVKTVDNILVYSTNSDWLDTPLTERSAGSFAEYRFSFRSALAPGDWFISLAVARASDHMCDVREDLIYLQVARNRQSSGFVHIEPKLFEESEPPPGDAKAIAGRLR